MFQRLYFLILLAGALFQGFQTSSGSEFRLTIRDRDTDRMLPCRVYLQDADGLAHFVRSTMPEGSEVPYDKQNWINAKSIEQHTTISAHPVVADLPPGKYLLTVERGKEYFPHIESIVVGTEPIAREVALLRWVNLTERGWYSSDTHLHRTLDELPNVILAEDLNVAFPLTAWVTKARLPPTNADRTSPGLLPDALIAIDESHVIWPRNTEYEIFSVGEQRHTLGALFVLNHRETLKSGVPPWRPVIEGARRQGALFDFDKLDWPFSLYLPFLAPDGLYELANNHNWRTEFAFNKWNSQTSPTLQPPFGAEQGSEREWLDYNLGLYYLLLNCGQRHSPTAGTANGVHPVPAGFGRVYVHLPDGFRYDAWLEGLRAGRSFVTTGPMLFAKLGGEPAGHIFQPDESTTESLLEVEVVSEQPLSVLEVVLNGKPVINLPTRSIQLPTGAHRTVAAVKVPLRESGWVAVRALEDRPDGKFRFAHTAPWYIERTGSQILPTPDERKYLLDRLQREFSRSEPVLSAEDLAEYRQVLDQISALPVRRPLREENARPLPTDKSRQSWIDNLLLWHQLTDDEVFQATGLPDEEIQRLRASVAERKSPLPPDKLTMLPYPGGRHPRVGFLDGALRPQRDTKVSVFPPWSPAGYLVVDLPEAIFTNLGLTYLAHTHVPTLWSERGIQLPEQEWLVHDDGSLSQERVLPNGIVFGASARLIEECVAMELWIKNGTDQTLTGIRAQVCGMLKGMPGFNARTNQNKIIQSPFAAVGNHEANRWIIMAWSPTHRAWGNPPVPCLHVDPTFPDCQPGQTVRAVGRLWFHDGANVEAKLQELTEEFSKISTR